MNKKDQKILVVGGGFAGVRAVNKLRGLGYEPVLITKHAHWVFLPLLPEVAGGALLPEDITFDYNDCLQKNSSIIYGEANNLNLVKHQLAVDNKILDFDYLVLAPGAKPMNFFPQAEAIFLSGPKEALALKQKIKDGLAGNREVTASIIGAGPTGLELAFALAAWGQKSSIGPSRLKVLMFTRGNTLDNIFGAGTNKLVDKLLIKSGIIKAGEPKEIINKKIITADGQEIDSDELIIATGVRPNTDWLPKEMLDEKGYIKVDIFLKTLADEKILAIGDAAAVIGHTPTKLAQVAVQQAVIAAGNIDKLIKRRPLKIYRQSIKGVFLSLGSSRALGRIGKWHWQGISAWLVWRLIYLLNIFGFKNKIKSAQAWTDEFLRHR